MATRPDLSAATAVVTGASSGIGAEIARQLVARGVGTVWLVARRVERLEALATELGSAARVFGADLSSDEGCRALVEAVPTVDVLVNNAGVLISEFFDVSAATDAVAQTRMVDVNCRAMVALTAAWLPGMVQRRRGWLLNVGSIAGDLVAPRMAVYGATKQFVNAFTECVGMEVRSMGVAVSLLAPGPVRTGMLDTLAAAGTPMPDLISVPVERCARQGLDRLFAGRARTTPKLLVRLMAACGALTPMWLMRPVMGSASRVFRARSQSDSAAEPPADRGGEPERDGVPHDRDARG